MRLKNVYSFLKEILCIFIEASFLNVNLCQKVIVPNLSFFSIPADFYDQNWPFLLLDTGLRVVLGKQKCPMELGSYILELYDKYK